MKNKKYDVLEDGTVIDEKYLEDTLKEADDALKNKTAKIIYTKPENERDVLRISFKKLPRYIRKELKPFFINV